MAQFVVLGEPSGPMEPSEVAFDDPAFGQHMKALLIAAFDDLDGVAEHLFGPVDQCAGVAAIGENPGDALEPAEQPHQHGTRPDPVLDAGRMDHDGQQISLRVYRDVALAALDLFAGVVAALPPFRAVLTV